MKIGTPKLKMLVNTELLEFFRQLVSLILKYGADKLKVAPKLKALEDLLPDLQKALDKEKSNELTKLLNELDRKRDVLISGFIKWLEAMTSYPDENIAKNATKMLAYVNGFGKRIAYETQLAETTILINITDGFTKNVERKDALATMNGSAWIEALQDANNKYSETYNTRLTDVSTNDQTESFSVLRQGSIERHEDLITLLNSRYQSDVADGLNVTVYEKCIGDINELINKINVLAQTSMTRKKEEKK